MALSLFVGGPGLLPQAPATVLAAPVESAVSAQANRRAPAAQADPAKQPAQSNPYEDPTQCTYRAWELAAKAGHRLPRFYNAENWRQAALDCGMRVEDTLTEHAVGGIAVWSAYTGGTGWAGHVGYVLKVEGNRFLVQERNWIPAADGERWVEWEEGISFIILECPEPARQAEPAEAPSPQPQPASGIGAQPLLPDVPWPRLDLVSAPNLMPGPEILTDC
ncbi:MAG: CHAP domain-containing protein [Anaerolineae bacterium]